MMKSEEIMLKIDNVSKIYKLGEIGGTTLRETLQRLFAKIRHKEDPTRKIGAKNYNKGELFKALDGVSFEAKKGERIGIIGHNGAGKSTLLKLISRVTGPSGGNIYLNGRVASMLEVGTGFNPELTGRENIYMNGAILGMTKKEIDAKMEDIIEFSEVREFIDTPVKRYSSGMYVKLAFSVAAHLDSEIMIMDEVLAVGDVAFQNKCLLKMRTVSEQEDRTILYVSHNMSTIRSLCDRVLVLDHGHILFDGEPEDAIGVYMGINSPEIHYVYKAEHHKSWKMDSFTIMETHILDKSSATYDAGETIKGAVQVNATKEFAKLRLRSQIYNSNGSVIGTSFSNPIDFKAGTARVLFAFDTKHLAPGRYVVYFTFFALDNSGNQKGVDGVDPSFVFDISNQLNEHMSQNWVARYWGNVHLPDTVLSIDDSIEC